MSVSVMGGGLYLDFTAINACNDILWRCNLTLSPVGGRGLKSLIKSIQISS